MKSLVLRVCVCVRVCVCACVHVRACMCVCVLCVRAGQTGRGEFINLRSAMNRLPAVQDHEKTRAREAVETRNKHSQCLHSVFVECNHLQQMR